MCSFKTFAAITLVALSLCTGSPAASSIVGKHHLPLVIDTFETQGVGTTVSISGRVKTPQGRPIKGASIVIKDAQTNAVVRTALSSGFGFYRLDQIETGRSYVLTVSHKTYLFALPSHLLELSEERNGVDFVGEIID